MLNTADATLLNRSTTIPDAVLSEAYGRLRSIALRMLDGERPEHTLQATELVHEALGRLLASRGVEVTNRESLSRLVTVVMRRVLVDHARSYRARRAREREVGRRAPEHRADTPDSDSPAEQFLRLNEAIEVLQTRKPRRRS